MLKEIHINRLKQLVDYLKTINDEDFSMESYASNPYLTSSLERDLIKEYSPECGTVCCVAGHAAVLNKDDIFFTKLFFIGDWFRRFYGIEYNIFKYLTSGAWIYTDNTLKGAIRRINYVIKHHHNPKNRIYNFNILYTKEEIEHYDKPEYDTYN